MKEGLVALVVGSTERRGRPVGAQWHAKWSGEGPGDLATGLGDEPDLTLTLSPEDALLVLNGELAPCVAYMQGRLKTAGDNGLLLRVLRWTATPAFRDAVAAWTANYPELAGLSPPAHPSPGRAEQHHAPSGSCGSAEAS